MSVFFLTQLCVFVVWDLMGLHKLNPFYLFTNIAFPINVLGFILGVGMTEKLAKVTPLLLILLIGNIDNGVRRLDVIDYTPEAMR